MQIFSKNKNYELMISKTDSIMIYFLEFEHLIFEPLHHIYAL